MHESKPDGAHVVHQRLFAFRIWAFLHCARHLLSTT